jgi:hypothetical protein
VFVVYARRQVSRTQKSKCRQSEFAMFKVIGAVLAVYVCYAIANGSVYAKSGISGRNILREDSPRYFWSVIAIYAALSLALVTLF